MSAPTTTWIDTLELHASVKEDYTYSVETTDFPVEKGVNFTDHARPKPNKISIKGIVSNTPNSAAQAASGDATTAYQFLIDLFQTPRLVGIVTGLDSFYSMAPDGDLKIPRDAKTGDVLEFEASFKFIRQVSNGQTVVATPKGRKKTVQGAKAPTAQPAYLGQRLTAIGQLAGLLPK